MNRRQFIGTTFLAGLGALLLPKAVKASDGLENTALRHLPITIIDIPSKPDRLDKYRCFLTPISAPDDKGNHPVGAEQFWYFPCGVSIPDPDEEPFRWNIKIETRELHVLPHARYFRVQLIKNGADALGGIYELKTADFKASEDRQKVELLTILLARCSDAVDTSSYMPGIGWQLDSYSNGRFDFGTL